MPLPRLNVEDPDRGLPRQPVPVRYAYLVTGLTPREFLDLLATRQEGRYEYLTAYEYDSGAPLRQVRADAYGKLLASLPGPPAETDDRALIEQLPAGHFVWSDELAWAFSQFIRDYLDDESATQEGMQLLWYPSLHGSEKLMAECLDLSALAPEVPVTKLTRRELGKQETEALHERWRQAYEELKTQHPGMSDVWIASRIALMAIAEDRDAETIRKNMKRK